VNLGQDLASRVAFIAIEAMARTSCCASIDFGASTSPALIAVIASSERPSLRKLARQLLKRWQEWRPPRYRAVAIFYRELGEERFRVVGEGRLRATGEEHQD